jgi:hypothetical protein
MMKGMSNRTPLKQHSDVAVSNISRNSLMFCCRSYPFLLKKNVFLMSLSGSYTEATLMSSTSLTNPSVSISKESIHSTHTGTLQCFVYHFNTFFNLCTIVCDVHVQRCFQSSTVYAGQNTCITMSKRPRYDIGLRSTHEVVDDAAQVYSLQVWDKKIEDTYSQLIAGHELPEPFLPENMWNEWLWGFDPTEPCHMECLMNRSHLLGLLLARYRAMYQVRYHTCNSTILELLGATNDVSRLCLFDTPVNTYSLRHLRDTVQNVQLNWIECSCASMPQMEEVVNALMHRFGVLALQAQGLEVMNDQGQYCV